MGLATWDICHSGTFNKNVKGGFVASGAHTTTTSVSSLTDSSPGSGTAVEAVLGDILTIYVDVPMRLITGGRTPNIYFGIYLTPGIPHNIEIDRPGTIRIRDVS